MSDPIADEPADGIADKARRKVQSLARIPQDEQLLFISGTLRRRQASQLPLSILSLFLLIIGEVVIASQNVYPLLFFIATMVIVVLTIWIIMNLQINRIAVSNKHIYWLIAGRYGYSKREFEFSDALSWTFDEESITLLYKEKGKTLYATKRAMRTFDALTQAIQNAH